MEHLVYFQRIRVQRTTLSLSFCGHLHTLGAHTEMQAHTYIQVKMNIAVAQSVEHETLNLRVMGLSPTLSAI